MLACTLGARDFDAQMSGIKFWKVDENLRPFYKKPFYEILSGYLHFWTFQFIECTHWLFYEIKTFSMNRSRGYKNSVFSY
jgi:hypothetical protein